MWPFLVEMCTVFMSNCARSLPIQSDAMCCPYGPLLVHLPFWCRVLLYCDMLYLSWFHIYIILFLFTKGVQIFQKSSSCLKNFRHKKSDMKQVSNLGSTNNRHHHAKFSCLGDLTPAICTALLFTSSETSSYSIYTRTKDSSSFIISKSKPSFCVIFF